MFSAPHLRLWKFALAAWLLVVSTSPAFSHDHADGDKPHSHGLGVLSASFRATDMPNRGIAPNTRHSHLVLFGIEIHVPASCPWAADQDSPVAAEQVFFRLGAEIENVCGTRAPETPVASPAPLGDVSAALDVPAKEACTDGLIVRIDPFLCDLARGLRSGAQQL